MEQAEGVNTNKCHCKTCDLVVLLARKGRVVANTELRVPREGGDALALEWETPAELLCVATQFDFENVCYSRNHKVGRPSVCGAFVLTRSEESARGPTYSDVRRLRAGCFGGGVAPR